MQVLPQQSVASHVRVINWSHPWPFVTVLSTVMVTLVPQQLSEAVGSLKRQGVPQITPMPGWHVIIGGVVSTTVTV